MRVHAQSAGPEDYDGGGPELKSTQRAVADLPSINKKISKNLLPIFFAMVLLSYIDRTNLAFASLQLNEHLGFTPQIYGFGSGLFFLGYASFQVPSNIVLLKIGAPRWLSFLIVAWGLCASSFCLITNKYQFYLLRFLLGATEAGAFPGMWYYLSLFYAEDAITKPYALMEAAISLSHTVAAPLAALLLSMDGWMGWRGWQWLFFLEGVPSVILGICIRFYIPEGPGDASFLTAEESTAVLQAVQGRAGDGAKPKYGTAPLPGSSWRRMLVEVGGNTQLWILSCVKIFKDVATFGLLFWAPQLIDAIINGASLDTSKLKAAHAAAGHSAGLQAALLTGIPFTLAAVAAFAVGHHSQVTRERHLHIAIPYLCGGFLMCLFPQMVAQSAAAGFAMLVAAIVGSYSGAAPTLSLVACIAAGPSLAVALPMFNAVGNLGGFVGPYLVGYLVQRLGSFALATVAMGLFLCVAGLIALGLKWHTIRTSHSRSGNVDQMESALAGLSGTGRQSSSSDALLSK